jgi:hypothetical protein
MHYPRSPITIVEIHVITVFDAPQMVPTATTLLAPEKVNTRERRRPDDRQPLRFLASDFYMGQ